MQDGAFNEATVTKLLSIIDQCLISDDKNLVKFSLTLLSQLYFYNIHENNLFNFVMAKDVYRKYIIISHLKSDKEVIRRQSFNVLTFLFFDKEHVAPLVFNRAANPIKESGFEKLGYIRTLGRALNDKQTKIRDFLVNEVMRAKGGSKYNAITVEAVHALSKLSNPPKEIVLPTIVMLEGRYFGDPMLLESIKNYGILMKPYLTRLKKLEKDVNERIL